MHADHEDENEDQNEDEDEDEGDGQAGIGDLFPFLVGEAEYLGDLESAIRRKLCSMSPNLLRKSAYFLFALGRLPYSTPGLAFDLSISDRGEGGMNYISVELSSAAFRLSKGGSVYTAGVGSDSFSETNFEAELGGFREGSSEDFYEWLSAFNSSQGQLKIEEIDLDADLDLTEEGESDGWERLAKYWEEAGEGDFGY